LQNALVMPRDPGLRLGSPSATRAAIAVVYALVVLVALAEVLRSLQRADRLDYTNYPLLGEIVLTGGDPYANAFNTWPPFFLLIAAGLALGSRISPLATLCAWQLASVVAVWGSLKLLARCFADGGAEATFWPRSPNRLAFVSAPILVPFLFTARLFDDNLQHGQINAQLLFLSLLAFVLFRERRPIAGAFVLALAASIKAMPVLLLGYLVYKRCWREVGWTLAFLVLLNLVIPVAIFGAGGVATQWHAWRAVIGGEMLQPIAHHPNQALLSALKRLLTVEGGSTNPLHFTLAAWMTATVVRVFWVVVTLVLAGLVWVFRHDPRELSDRRCAGEFVICLAAMTLVSPIAWVAHYVTLVAPAALVCVALREMPDGAAGRRWRLGVWGASFACLTFSGSGFVGWAWARRLESLSVITVGAVLLVALAVSLLPALGRGTAEG
jgi:Glycosyltransferase family 87